MIISSAYWRFRGRRSISRGRKRAQKLTDELCIERKCCAASSWKTTCCNYPALFVIALLICVLDLLIWFILLWSFYYADPWHSFWHYRNVLCSLCCRQFLCSICRHSADSFCAAFADILHTAFVQHLQLLCSICRHTADSFCAAFADIVQTAFVQHLQT